MRVSTEPQITKILQKVFPWVTRAHLDENDWTRLIIQAAPPTETAPRELVTYTLEALHYVKAAIVVDRDIDIYDPRDVAFALATRMQPDKDLVVRSNLKTLELDPSSSETQAGFSGAKIGFDATMPLANSEKYEKIRTPEAVDRKIGRLLRSYL